MGHRRSTGTSYSISVQPLLSLPAGCRAPKPRLRPWNWIGQSFVDELSWVRKHRGDRHKAQVVEIEVQMRQQYASMPVATNFSLGADVSFRGEAEVGRSQSPLPRPKMNQLV
jgi:hypothetical protein